MEIHLNIAVNLQGLDWSTFCLTSDHQLWILGQVQHQIAFAQHGIQWNDILISGYTRRGGTSIFRSSEGVDRGCISVDESLNLMAEVSHLIRQEKLFEG